MRFAVRKRSKIFHESDLGGREGEHVGTLEVGLGFQMITLAVVGAILSLVFWGQNRKSNDVYRLQDFIFFSANARSSDFSLKRGKMIQFIENQTEKPYNTKPDNDYRILYIVPL
jgi:hypothetical protein